MRSALIPSHLWLFAGAAAVFTAYASAFLPGGEFAASPYLLIGGTASLLVGLMSLGAVTRRRASSGMPLLIGMAVWLVAGFSWVLGMPIEDPANPVLILGLPARAAVLLYGVGLLPALLIPLAYALLFDRHTITDEDLATLEKIKAETTTSAPRVAE